MAQYRKIDVRIWGDGKFLSLSDTAQLLFFFLLTHPHMTPLGAMRETFAGLASEKGWSLEAFEKAFGEVLEKGMVKACQKPPFIWLPNFVKYNPPQSPNVVVAWGKSIGTLPECFLLDECLATAISALESREKSFLEAFHRYLPKASGKASGKVSGKVSGNQELELEQELEKDRNILVGEEKLSPTDNPPKKTKHVVLAEKLLAYLNDKLNRNGSERYKKTTPIPARMKEGLTEEEAVLIIDYKVAEWQGTDYEKYLRPSTLFGPQKSPGYLSDAKKWENQGRPSLNGKSPALFDHQAQGRWGAYDHLAEEEVA